jgi:broad specificity phosphatase PhoE
MELHKKQPVPQPPLITSEDLREQHFGEAEGQPWTMLADPGKSLAQHMAEGIYPAMTERNEKFPTGESLNDLEKRAEKAIQELIMPHIWKAAKDGRKGVQVAVVSHGLCISEERTAHCCLLFLLTFVLCTTNSLYQHCSRRVPRVGRL